MLSRESIVPGRYLKTVTDRLGVPAKTMAMVDTVGCFRTGAFVFTVRWLNLQPRTQIRPVSDRSLNLWEEDLVHFEAVKKEEDTANTAPASPTSKPNLKPLLGSYRRLGWKRAVSFVVASTGRPVNTP